MTPSRVMNSITMSLRMNRSSASGGPCGPSPPTRTDGGRIDSGSAVRSDEPPEVVVGAVVVPDHDLRALGRGGTADPEHPAAVGALDAEVAVGPVAQSPPVVRRPVVRPLENP